jgi:flagellar FliL protein
MAEEAKKEAGEGGDKAASASPPKKKLAKLLPFVVGGVLSAGLGVGAAIVTAPPAKHADDGAEKEAAKPTTPLDKFAVKKADVVLPQIITNLADTVSGRFSIHLEVYARTEEEFKKLGDACAKSGKSYAAIRDTLLALLSTKTSADLKTLNGKEVLKLEIVDRLRPILFPKAEDGLVTDVFFEDFLLQ